MNKMFKLANGSLVSLDTIQSIRPVTWRECFYNANGLNETNNYKLKELQHIYTGNELRAMGIKYGLRMGRFLNCTSWDEAKTMVKKNKMRILSGGRIGYTDYNLPISEDEEFLSYEYYYDEKTKKVMGLQLKNYGVKDEDLDNVIMYDITTSVRLNLGLNGTDNVTFCIRPEEYERLVKNFEIV